MTYCFADGSQVIVTRSFGVLTAWKSGPWVPANIYQLNGFCYPKDRVMVPMDDPKVLEAMALFVDAHP